MRTHLLTLNLSGLTNTVFDGNHYLSLGPDVVFEGSPVDTKMVACATNHHAGWKLDPAYGSGTGITYEGTSTGWLQVTAAPAAGTIELKTRSVNSGAERVAWVHVNAGRLTHKLKVTQQ